jgi:tRNA pseudouridine38-40 synthase
LTPVNEPGDPQDRRIRLTLHYDGSGFAGWQAQPGTRTVQSELEAALCRLTDRPAAAIAAGRTDSGVHATGQVVSTLVPAKWPAGMLRKALNAVLPRDIWIADAAEAPLSFHARYDAVARGYSYRIGIQEVAAVPPSGAGAGRSREVRWSVGCAAARLPGTSFAAFEDRSTARGEYCTVLVGRPGTGRLNTITANASHHMVRYRWVPWWMRVERRPPGDVALLAKAPDI